MAGRKPRKDAGTKRVSYNLKVDTTGKTVKENNALKSFWSTYKMEDIIQLSTEELDIKIAEWIDNFQTSQLKRNKFWWYPTVHYDPTPKVKKEKKINTNFNSSFRNS
jgi:hypothetical protein